MLAAGLGAGLLAAGPVLAQGEDPAAVSADFLGMVDRICMPWVAEGRAPDTGGLVPYDPDNPAHQAWEPVPEGAHFAQGGRTLVAWYVEEGERRCGLTFFEVEGPDFRASPLANAVAQAMAAWVRALGRGPDWVPIFTCVQGGFGLFLVYERVAPLRAGVTVSLIASTGGSHTDPGSWGAFATISMSEDAISDQPSCIGEEG